MMRYVSSIVRVANGLVLAIALVACSGNSLLTNGKLPSGKSDAGAYDTGGVTEPDAVGLNPLASSPSTSFRQRVVIENPTFAQVMERGALPEMALGRADAPVTIIKYASMTCPHCRKFHAEVFPKLKRNYIDTGKVRFIVREFPIGRSSGNATIALRCAPESKYFTLYGKFMAQQSKWVSQSVRLDAIYGVAKQVGLSRAQFDACLKNQEMIKALNAVKDRGRTLGVIGTPNFFIQNELVKARLDYEKLSERIDKLLAAPVADAGASSG